MPSSISYRPLFGVCRRAAFGVRFAAGMSEIGWLAERPVVGGKQALNHSTSLCNQTDRAIVYAVTALKTGTENPRVQVVRVTPMQPLFDR
ncbi:hypothetical protein MPLA_180083 [Mesorhizobium sp. ORS 3359]|nr:hypothetical protein MPLA_180083 [Mesorhizobium sp. ORS 3359]